MTKEVIEYKTFKTLFKHLQETASVSNADKEEITFIIDLANDDIDIYRKESIQDTLSDSLTLEDGTKDQRCQRLSALLQTDTKLYYSKYCISQHKQECGRHLWQKQFVRL